jgi:hypothetical protein
MDSVKRLAVFSILFLSPSQSSPLRLRGMLTNEASSNQLMNQKEQVILQAKVGLDNPNPGNPALNAQFKSAGLVNSMKMEQEELVSEHEFDAENDNNNKNKDKDTTDDNTTDDNTTDDNTTDDDTTDDNTTDDNTPDDNTTDDNTTDKDTTTNNQDDSTHEDSDHDDDSTTADHANEAETDDQPDQTSNNNNNDNNDNTENNNNNNDNNDNTENSNNSNADDTTVKNDATSQTNDTNDDPHNTETTDTSNPTNPTDATTENKEEDKETTSTDTPPTTKTDDSIEDYGPAKLDPDEIKQITQWKKDRVANIQMTNWIFYLRHEDRNNKALTSVETEAILEWKDIQTQIKSIQSSPDPTPKQNSGELPHPGETIFENNVIPPMIRALQNKQYVVDQSEDGVPNLIGIRSSIGSNTFDDAIAAVWRKENTWHQIVWPATTDPGRHWLENPMDEKGAAVLVAGQYVDTW